MNTKWHCEVRKGLCILSCFKTSDIAYWSYTYHYHTIHQGFFMILSWEIDSSFSPPWHKEPNVWIRSKIEGYVFFMVRWSIVTSACLHRPILMREPRPNSVSWEKSLKKRIIKLDNRRMEDCVREVNGGSFFLLERSIMFGDSFLSGSYPVIFLSSLTADSTTYLILFPDLFQSTIRQRPKLAGVRKEGE